MPTITDNTIVLASDVCIWNFYQTEAEAVADLERANNHRLNQEQKYRPMTYADYKALERAGWLSDPAEQITEEMWRSALECLPPMKWTKEPGFESFLMSEFMSGVYTRQYAIRGDGETATYWRKMVDATDKTTWLQR